MPTLRDLLPILVGAAGAAASPGVGRGILAAGSIAEQQAARKRAEEQQAAIAERQKEEQDRKQAEETVMRDAARAFIGGDRQRAAKLLAAVDPVRAMQVADADERSQGAAAADRWKRFAAGKTDLFNRGRERAAAGAAQLMNAGDTAGARDVLGAIDPMAATRIQDPKAEPPRMTINEARRRSQGLPQGASVSFPLEGGGTFHQSGRKAEDVQAAALEGLKAETKLQETVLSAGQKLTSVQSELAKTRHQYEILSQNPNAQYSTDPTMPTPQALQSRIFDLMEWEKLWQNKKAVAQLELENYRKTHSAVELGGGDGDGRDAEGPRDAKTEPKLGESVKSHGSVSAEELVYDPKTKTLRPAGA